jgi:hypothetical protein
MRLIILNFFLLYSGDVTADVNHLYIKIIHLVSFSYIVIENKLFNEWSGVNEVNQ